MSTSFVLLTVFTPEELTATTRVVDPNKSGGCLTSDSPPCYTTIGAAITAADTATGDDIFVEPGTYQENLSLSKNISIQGRETARTIISGGGSGTILTVSGVNSITIYNFTFIDAAVGISVSNSTNVDIINNVFNLGKSLGTAVNITDVPSSTEIINNTFYENYIAILATADITIKNNILDNNATALSPGTRDMGLITFNLFNANTDNGPSDTDLQSTTNILNQSPLFVDTATRDFHVEEGSPVIAAGDGSEDIGAYGGASADTIPFPVSILSAVDSSVGPPPYQITVSWSENLSHLVTHTTTPGGYNVHYSENRSGAPYDTPIDALTATSEVLTGLTAASAPAAPVIDVARTEYANGTIKVYWSSVLNATGYKVYYRNIDAVPAPPELSDDVMNVTEHAITGLINGDNYEIEVTAYTQNTYYIAVTAYDSSGLTLEPGVQHESDYSIEETVDIGPVAEGLRSNTETEYPEAIVPHPNLPNEGCFIATAAYGYYSAPQVQALRDFRDQYLLPNTPGKAFVNWYYTYGPIAARFINEHPWLKPAVRVGLLPAVGVSTFMTRTTMPAKMAVVIFTVLALFFIVQRRLHRKLSQH